MSDTFCQACKCIFVELPTGGTEEIACGVQGSPADFRPYLAKGLVLQQQGQKGDATRFFIQARYYAPASSRGVVDAIIGQQR